MIVITSQNKPLIWTVDIADGEFSKYIRSRDGRCMNPLCISGLQHEAPISALDNSHFWGRGEIIARYDPDNCIALCRPCHKMWEHTKQGRYRELMIRLIGYTRYKALQHRVEEYKYKANPTGISYSQILRNAHEFLKPKQYHGKKT